MTRRWAGLALLSACFLLSGCSAPPSAPAAAQTPSTAPAAVPVSPTTDTVAVTSSPPALGSDQSYLDDLRQHSHAGTLMDATLVTLGNTFCTQLRAGMPAKWVMDDMIKKITGAHLSGTITDSQETQVVMDFADIDRIATKHYCPEHMTQVMAAFLQEAAAGRGDG